MPTVLRIGKYRFFFFSNENQEPAHVHIKAGDELAKFWLNPVRLCTNHGFRPRDINEMTRIVIEYQDQLMESWNAYFG